MENLFLLSLEYTHVIDRFSNPFFQTNSKLWRPALECSHIKFGNTLIKAFMDNLNPMYSMITRLNTTSGSAKISLNEGFNNRILMLITLNGSKEYVSDSRLKILRNYNRILYKQIKLSRREFKVFSANPSPFISKIIEIADEFEVEIVIDDKDTDFKVHFENLDYYSVYVVGFEDNITSAEINIRALIDHIVNGFLVDFIELDLACIPIIGGINLANYTQIAKQSNLKIYIPDLLPEILNSGLLETTKCLKVLVSAKEVYQILTAKEIISRLLKKITTSNEETLVRNEVNMARSKIDLLILNDQAEILHIMSKHGTFIQMPSLGERTCSTIIVQGQSKRNVDETIYDINLLCTRYYDVYINFNGSFKNGLESFLLDLISMTKTCVLTYNSYGVNITGEANEVKAILQSMNSNYFFWKNVFKGMNLGAKIEVSLEQRDFISGKKNGKITKILSNLDHMSRIKFCPYNEYDFFIDLRLTDESITIFGTLLKAIELIELELQAELRFNIPDVFHKSIIGNGGSIIQSIMKRYNVFIKFSSNCDAKQPTVFYSFMRSPNVLIKCPSKNSKNIALVKREIDQVVTQLCLGGPPVVSGATSYHTEYVQIWKSHYLLLINSSLNLDFIAQLEVETNTFIDFPETIDKFGRSNSILMPIMGSERKVKTCVQKLRTYLPKNFVFKLTYCRSKYNKFLGESTEFCKRIETPFRIILGIEVSLTSISGSYHQVILSYLPPAEKNLGRAIQIVTTYLRQKEFLIQEKGYIDLDSIMEKESECKTLKPITNTVKSFVHSKSKESECITHRKWDAGVTVHQASLSS